MSGIVINHSQPVTHNGQYSKARDPLKEQPLPLIDGCNHKRWNKDYTPEAACKRLDD